MFWLLRRTGAASLFNSLNSTCNNNGNTYSTQQQEKCGKRPERKAYGRLSAEGEAEDGVPLQHKIDVPFDDPDNFEVITNGSHPAANVGSKAAPCKSSNMDGQGNFVVNDLCDLSACAGNGDIDADGYGDGDGYRDGDGADGNGNGNVEFTKTQNASCNAASLHIQRLLGMELAEDDIDDEDEYDESLACNVCDRGFTTQRQLAAHQQKKRHFGCNGCDSLFPTLMTLEHHKEEFEHWSDDELTRHICCRRSRDDYFTDTDSCSSELESEDQERLL